MEDNMNRQNENISISFSTNLLGFICSLAALGFLVLTKMLNNFIMDGTFASVMAIFIYSVAFAGIVLNFIFGILKKKKIAADFWFSVAVMAISLMVL